MTVTASTNDQLGSGKDVDASDSTMLVADVSCDYLKFQLQPSDTSPAKKQCIEHSAAARQYTLPTHQPDIGNEL